MPQVLYFKKERVTLMNISTHPSKPHRRMVQLRVTDKVTLASLLFFAEEHAIEDGPPKSEDALIWLQFGHREPTAYRVGYLRKYAVHKATLDAEKGISLPERRISD